MEKNTLIINLNTENDNENIQDGSFQSMMDAAAQILKNGGTVIFPTETVYGLGGNALDPAASKKIYKAKGRPSDNPLIVHISSINMLQELVEAVGENEKKLINAFWPGPLTIIFQKSPKVPFETTGGLHTVAIRMPSDKIALSLIEKAGIPVAAPSANLSGKPSITSGEYVIGEMKGRVDAIIVHKDSEIGLESTVIDMTEKPPIILRPGKIGKEEIEQVLELPINMDASLKDPNEKPRSPGMKYRHYSPNAEIIVVTGTPQEMHDKASSELNRLLKQQKSVRVAVLSHRIVLYGQYGIDIGKNSEQAAKNIFKLLRDIDHHGIEYLIFEAIEGDDMAQAVMNRMIKASGNQIL